MHGTLEPMDKRALGERIARLRKDRKMSQDELASTSGVARRTLQILEKGSGNPTADTLNSLARALKVSFEEITGQTARQALTESLAKQSRIDPSLREAARVLEALASAGPARRAIVMYLLFHDPIYLEILPESAPIARLLGKVP